MSTVAINWLSCDSMYTFQSVLNNNPRIAAMPATNVHLAPTSGCSWSINIPIVYIAYKLRTRNRTIPHMGVRIRSVHETPTPPIVNPFCPDSKLVQP